MINARGAICLLDPYFAERAQVGFEKGSKVCLVQFNEL